MVLCDNACQRASNTGDITLCNIYLAWMSAGGNGIIFAFDDVCNRYVRAFSVNGEIL